MNKVSCPLHSAAKKYGSRPAIVTDEKIYSYRDLEQIVSLTVNHLRKFGVQNRQRVVIQAPNGVEYITVLLALWRIGAIACAISPRFPRSAVRVLTKQLNCQKFFAERFLLSLRALYRTIKGEAISSRNNPAVSIPLNRDATILFTSGTTAAPKAVLHSYANHYYSAKGANVNMSLGPEDRWLLTLPLYHVGGLAIIFRILLAGSTLVIAPPKMSREAAMRNFNVTHISLVYTQLYRLLSTESGMKALSNLPAGQAGLKAILLGGSAIPRFIIKKTRILNLPIYTTYGSTEMASQVTTTRKNDSLKKLQTSGRLLIYRRLRVDKHKEILVKGRTLFKGYLEGSRLSLPLTKHGWFPTGDLGELDPEGYLTVLGRKDNMFISGGENIHPEEIEGLLPDMDGIREALVVPVRNKEFGQRPVALIKTDPKVQLSQKKVSQYLQKHLPRFKIPDTFYLWPEQTEESSWKIDRKSLSDFIERNAAKLKKLF
jgi:O-succinylbenzoic acid--CoA ligase